MSKHLLVLGCSQTQREAPGMLPAIDRFHSLDFKVLKNYLRDQVWPADLSVAILSAKYGLKGGFAGMDRYEEKMTIRRAESLAPECLEILDEWAGYHEHIHFSIGKNYLPAVVPALEHNLRSTVDFYEGTGGNKAGQIKALLESTNAPTRPRPPRPKAGIGQLSYFLPDWDDLLDPDFDFVNDSFSAPLRRDRNDKHCSILMQPTRMFDGVLVSLAQHVTSKGPLKKILGTEAQALAPINMRERFGLSENQFLFGDCGAFSYVNEEVPAISVEQAVALYELHQFDFGASVDHIPVPEIKRDGKKIELTEAERKQRVALTKSNAEAFIAVAKGRKAGFTPVGTVQGLSAEEYADIVAFYHSMGYRHMALGGLVPLKDNLIEEIVTVVMNRVNQLKPRPWIHLFGIFRPKLQTKFRDLKVDSFDSATYFRKAWLRSDQNYLAPNGKWYASLRVPMTSDGRTRNKLEQAGLDIEELQQQESNVLDLLNKYGRHEVSISEALDALIAYDEQLVRTSDSRSLREKYRRTLEDRPWENCTCNFCQEIGIHVLIFRGSNRNKRRGTHNTLMLYNSLET